MSKNCHEPWLVWTHPSMCELPSHSGVFKVIYWPEYWLLWQQVTTISNAHVCTRPEIWKHSCMSENVLPLEFIQSLKLNGPIVSSAKEVSCIIDILKVCATKLITCSVGLFSLTIPALMHALCVHYIQSTHLLWISILYMYAHIHSTVCTLLYPLIIGNGDFVDLNNPQCYYILYCTYYSIRYIHVNTYSHHEQWGSTIYKILHSEWVHLVCSCITVHMHTHVSAPCLMHALRQPMKHRKPLGCGQLGKTAGWISILGSL